MTEIEELYLTIAEDILAFIAGRHWDTACGKYGIYHTMVSCEWWVELNGIKDETGMVPPKKY